MLSDLILSNSIKNNSGQHSAFWQDADFCLHKNINSRDIK